MKKQPSKFLKLKSIDFWKGLIVAIFSSCATTIYNLCQEYTTLDSFNWQIIIISAFSGFTGYVLKNLLSDEDGNFLSKNKK